MMDPDPNAPQGGLRGAARRLMESATGFLSAKFELVGIELQEEKRRILELLVLAATALLFAVLALTLLTFSIVALFWDSHRMAALFTLCGVYVLISGFLFMRLQRKASLTTKVFETTVEELKKDTEWVRRHL